MSRRSGDTLWRSCPGTVVSCDQSLGIVSVEPGIGGNTLVTPILSESTLVLPVLVFDEEPSKGDAVQYEIWLREDGTRYTRVRPVNHGR